MRRRVPLGPLLPVAFLVLLAAQGPQECVDDVGSDDETSLIVESNDSIFSKNVWHDGGGVSTQVQETQVFTYRLNPDLPLTVSCGDPTRPTDTGPCLPPPQTFDFRLYPPPGGPLQVHLDAAAEASGGGFSINWSVAKASAQVSVPPVVLEAEGTWRFNFLTAFPTDLPSGAVFRAYPISWGGATSESKCSLTIEGAGAAPIVVLADGTPTLVLITGTPGVAIPLTLEHRCTVSFPDDCNAGSDPSCLPLNLAGEAAGAFVVEIQGQPTQCRRPLDCNSSAPFCVNGTCRSGSEGAQCQHAGHCSPGLGCSRDFRCHDGDPGDPCEADFDCPNSQACVTRVCRAGEVGDFCTEDADCAPTSPLCSISPGGTIGDCAL
jgi:hypothetical protein